METEAQTRDHQKQILGTASPLTLTYGAADTPSAHPAGVPFHGRRPPAWGARWQLEDCALTM